MKNNWIPWLIIAVLIGYWHYIPKAAVSDPAQSASSEIGRYQAVRGDNDVFLVDTKTGASWVWYKEPNRKLLTDIMSGSYTVEYRKFLYETAVRDLYLGAFWKPAVRFDESQSAANYVQQLEDNAAKQMAQKK
jgi:hypothetical protein